MRLGGLGAPELILIVLAIVLIFGASKLGDIGGAMGKSIREFRKASKDPEDNTTQADPSPSPPVAVVTPSTPTELKGTPVAVSDSRPPDVKTN